MAKEDKIVTTEVAPAAPATASLDATEVAKKAEEARLAALDSNKAREAAAAVTGLAYCVLPGISISTAHRGIVEEGQPVTAADFSDGETSLKDLIRRGLLVQKQIEQK